MTRIENPLITVLMSCYNAEKWLNDSIQSIINQTYANFEFLIINDGSTDKSPEILKRYAALDSRITLIHQSNLGLANSLNKGIANARGLWIARMDADDISEPTRLERQITLASQYPSAVFIGTGLTLIDNQGVLGATFIYPKFHGQLLIRLRRALPFPPHSSAFYRNDIAKSVGGYRGRIKKAEDWDLWLRLSEKGSLMSIPEALVRIRKHPDQISLEGGGYNQYIDCRVAIISYFLRRFGLEDPVSEVNEATFLSFYSWIKSHFAEADYLQNARWKNKVKYSLESRGYLVFYTTLFSSPRNFLRLLLEKISGDYRPYFIAQNWLFKNKL